VLAELNSADATDEEINKITWQNACRFFGWDPFAYKSKDEMKVSALRASSVDVEVSIRSRKEWAELYALQAAT